MIEHSTKTLYLSKEDKVRFIEFEQLLRRDKAFKRTIPEIKLRLLTKNGFISEGIRYLVNFYIAKHKEVMQRNVQTTPQNNNNEESHIG